MDTPNALTELDFTDKDKKDIRKLCIEHTQGEETWHEFILSNGKPVDVDCFDSALIYDDPWGFIVSVYVMRTSTAIFTGLGSYELDSIPYAEMTHLAVP